MIRTDTVGCDAWATVTPPDGLAVRSGLTPDSEEIGRIPAGKPLWLAAASQNQFLVRATDESPAGWVSGEALGARLMDGWEGYSDIPYGKLGEDRAVIGFTHCQGDRVWIATASGSAAVWNRALCEPSGVCPGEEK